MTRIDPEYLRMRAQTPRVNSADGRGPVKSAGTDKTDKKRTNASGSFDSVLKAALEKKTTFSRHALNRMANRGIEFSPEELTRLEAALDKAQAKNVDQALLLLDEKAVLVNVREQNVITVMNQQDARDKVFTNIDSVVIA